MAITIERSRAGSLLLAAIACAALLSQDASASFDHAWFCRAAQDVAHRANAQRGSSIDEHTRHEGMTVECASTSVELKLSVDVPFSAMPQYWQDRISMQWSDDYCSDPAWSEAITYRWNITLLVQSTAGETFSVRADCH